MRPLRYLSYFQLPSTWSEAGGEESGRSRAMENDKIGQLTKGVTKEGKGEYVTYGDSKSHEIIVSGLKAGWPNLPYQSEGDRPHPCGYLLTATVQLGGNGSCQERRRGTNQSPLPSGLIL